MLYPYGTCDPYALSAVTNLVCRLLGTLADMLVVESEHTVHGAQ